MINANKQLTFLKLTISGHPLFKDEISFSVVNSDRVLEDYESHLHHLFGSVWVNKLITLIGKNATGKTTTMKAVIGLLTFLLQAKSIEQTQLNDVLLGTNPIQFTTYFYGSDQVVYKDVLTFNLNQSTNSWYVTSEKIYRKKVPMRTPKRSLFTFPTSAKPVLDRDQLDPIVASVLAPDDSMFRTIISQQQYQTQTIVDTLVFTNVNALVYNNPNVPNEILQFLDPTIEYLKIDQLPLKGGTKQLFYRLKFKNSPEEFTETNFATIEHYLSSGTAKGVTLYGNVLLALKTGGIIFVDELENHFNHTIVRSFIEYFTDPEINKNNATLIFSTHYSELLSDIELNDEIYFTKRETKIELQRYSQANVRKDLNRSDVFDSDYLGGTSPDYHSYMELKNATKGVVND